MALSTFQVSDDFSVACFARKSMDQGPWFAVREWDLKVIRKNSVAKEKSDKIASGSRTINRSSEQAIRARFVLQPNGFHAPILNLIFV